METDQIHSRTSTSSVTSSLERLNLDQGTLLVKSARNAITSHFDNQPVGQISDPINFPYHRGIFVSLFDISCNRALRGCIGDPYGTEPIIETVQRIAIEAATNDYRFEPVTKAEFDKQIIVDVNVLSELQVIVVKNPIEYLGKVKVGQDGLMVDSQEFRGLLLPQVALEQGFDAEEFLCQCCMKAGMLPDSWLTGRVRISKFQSQIFEELKPNGHVVEIHVDSSTK